MAELCGKQTRVFIRGVVEAGDVAGARMLGAAILGAGALLGGVTV